MILKVVNYCTQSQFLWDFQCFFFLPLLTRASIICIDSGTCDTICVSSALTIQFFDISMNRYTPNDINLIYPCFSSRSVDYPCLLATYSQRFPWGSTLRFSLFRGRIFMRSCYELALTARLRSALCRVYLMDQPARIRIQRI